MICKTLLLTTLLSASALADSPSVHSADQGPRSKLPVLYRVDQPTSNVVVFRGAEVAQARAAGILPSAQYKRPQPQPHSQPQAYQPAPTTTYAPPTTTTTEYVAPTTTEAPVEYVAPATEAPEPAYKPAPVQYRPAPAYRPAPVQYRPAPVAYKPAPAPVAYKPAPVAYKPAPAPAYKPRPAYQEYKEPAYPAVPAYYNWEYEVLDHYSGNDFGHKESREGYEATGKYYVALPDGRRQTVTYVANKDGYVPTVVYEGEAQYQEQAQGYDA